MRRTTGGWNLWEMNLQNRSTYFFLRYWNCLRLQSWCFEERNPSSHWTISPVQLHYLRASFSLKYIVLVQDCRIITQSECSNDKAPHHLLAFLSLMETRQEKKYFILGYRLHSGEGCDGGGKGEVHSENKGWISNTPHTCSFSHLISILIRENKTHVTQGQHYLWYTPILCDMLRPRLSLFRSFSALCVIPSAFVVDLCAYIYISCRKNKNNAFTS